MSQIIFLIVICLSQIAQGQLCSQYSHKVDFDDIDHTIWTRNIPGFTMDPDLSLDGAGAGNIIVLSSNFHKQFDIDFQFATTVKEVSLRVLLAHSISLEIFDTTQTSLLNVTIQVPSFSWFTTYFQNLDLVDVSKIRITWEMDEQGREMGIKRLFVTTCPECPDDSETINFHHTDGLTLEVTPPPFKNPNNILAGSAKSKRFTKSTSMQESAAKFEHTLGDLSASQPSGRLSAMENVPETNSDSKQIEATFSSAVTIQMVRLQMKTEQNAVFNVTMYESTTPSFASTIYTEEVAVTGSGSWSNDLHVIPFSPIHTVRLIIITFTYPGTSIRVRNLAFDKCVSTA